MNAAALVNAKPPAVLLAVAALLVLVEPAGRSGFDEPRLASPTEVTRWRQVHTGLCGPVRRLMTVEQIASYR